MYFGFPGLPFGLAQSQISQHQHVCCENSLLFTKLFCSFAILAQTLICCCWCKRTMQLARESCKYTAAWRLVDHWWKIWPFCGRLALTLCWMLDTQYCQRGSLHQHFQTFLWTDRAHSTGLPKPWRDRRVRRDRYSICFARPVCLRGRSVCPVCQ